MIDDAQNSARELLLGGDATEGSAWAVGASGAALLATLAVFLVRPAIAPLVFGAFLVVTAIGWVTYQAEIARMLTLIATVLTVLTVTFITIFLFARSVPAFLEHGLGLLLIPEQNGQARWFFWLDAVLPSGYPYWNPSSDAFSLIPMIWATVVVTIIAGSIAGPLGLFGALFIAEVASDGLREVIKPGVEVLAGIPSIVYGFIGFQVLNGFIQKSFLDDGASFLIAGVVVGVMALPTVVSVGEDALSSVPEAMGDGSIAMGATKWQTMKSISIPAAFSGISAGVILGLGRAIGETMAVAAIMASGTQFADPLFDIFDANATLTSLIATQYGSASESTIEVLFVAGVMLFVIVAGMSVVSQYIEQQMQEKLKGQQ
ncbi:phosphate ABC transporter permease subunit PstC [Haloarcula nitratireducens]|uniref:Phosphate transport system permease protein n=1 Tax=Haloarcula nitratireducens TaxID=2487749 RepID=A0AAW4PCD2_9EURY|nr:phosphate ABC transporter permease subunit PstC [Halomicroarcula nitratireducens]MBX0295545.1 phosphate ABC transporter permease subunit PstC [Halomicroarcula nitratireducens]